MAVNRVGGSGWQQAAVFAVACVLFIVAGAAAGWGSGGTRLRLRAADARGRPRQLGDLELGELGVQLSRATADGYGPYVAREADRELNEAISGGKTLVAVSGVALAGRTRTLAEAARRHLEDSWLVWFDRPGTRLADMVAEARRLARGGPVVLWLENADLTPLEQLSSRLLDELPPGFRVLMTLDVALMDAGVLPAEAAQVLSAPGACARLGPITAPERERLLAEPAYAEIAAASADEPLMGRIMVSLDRVTHALETSDAESICRVAVLHAAVDWQRAAVPEPLTTKVIEELYHKGYWQGLARRGPDAAVSRSGFRQAIKDLLAPAPRDGPQLLDEVYYSGRVTHLRPHSLLATVADNPQRPPGWAISETLWNYLAKTLKGPQRLNVGLNAYSRGDYRHARRLLGSLDVAAIPAEIIFRIASDAHYSGQTTAARTWYAKAVASGHADYAPWAMVGLGVLESVPGRIEEARKWYTKAIESAHADHAPEAMANLGKLEKEQGRIEEARKWYTKAVESGHADVAPAAMFGLGVLEEEQGRIEEARTWYARAIESGHADVAPGAMFRLGKLEKEQGRIEEARTWYARAIESGHADAAPLAMCNLGNLEKEQGRIEEARTWYARAIESGHADAAPLAMFNLGKLEKEQHRIEEARTWYARAIESDHAEWAPKAMVELGLLERYQGRAEEARALFNRAINTGEAEAAPVAMFNLGALEHQQRRIEEARTWYAKAIASGRAEAAPAAMFGLGVLEQEQGRIEEARTWYAKAIASGQPDWASRAQAQLDQLDRHQEDLQRAENFAKYGSPGIDADFDQRPAAAESAPGNPQESST